MSRWTQHLFPIPGEVEDLHYTNEAGVQELRDAVERALKQD